MAYTKQNFKDGQVLKAEHLEKMENGILDAQKGGGIAYINFVFNEDMTLTSEKTPLEVIELIQSGVTCYANIDVFGSKMIAPCNTVGDDQVQFSIIAPSTSLEGVIATITNLVVIVITSEWRSLGTGQGDECVWAFGTATVDVS